MARGRTPNLVPTVQWAIMVPVDLALQVEARLLDPVTRKPKYAERSRLIQSLLHQWVQLQGGVPGVIGNVTCPECHRPKAQNEQDVRNGCCPKWLLPDDLEAHEDCAAKALFFANPPTDVGHGG